MSIPVFAEIGPADLAVFGIVQTIVIGIFLAWVQSALARRTNTAVGIAIAGETAHHNAKLLEQKTHIDRELANLKLLFDQELAKQKHHHDLQLALFNRDLRIRDQASRVAELLALRFFGEANRTELNRLAWELYLWLPRDVACELTRCIMGEVEPREVIIAVRKVLLGEDAGSLKAGDLAIILSQEEHDRLKAAAEAKLREDQRKMKEFEKSPLGQLSKQAEEEELRQLRERQRESPG